MSWSLSPRPKVVVQSFLLQRKRTGVKKALLKTSKHMEKRELINPQRTWNSFQAHPLPLSGTSLLSQRSPATTALKYCLWPVETEKLLERKHLTLRQGKDLSQSVLTKARSHLREFSSSEARCWNSVPSGTTIPTRSVAHVLAHALAFLLDRFFARSIKAAEPAFSTAQRGIQCRRFTPSVC